MQYCNKANVDYAADKCEGISRLKRCEKWQYIYDWCILFSPGRVVLYKRMGSARLCWSWSSCWPSWSSGWSSFSQSGGSADVKSRWKLTFSIFLSLSIYLSEFPSIYLFIDPYFFCLSIFIFLISPWNKTFPAVPIHSVNFPFQLTDNKNDVTSSIVLA